MNTMTRCLISLIMIAVLVGCGGGEQATALPERAIPVTTVVAHLAPVEVTERTVGRLEAATAPMVAAEGPGRIVEMLKDAGDPVEVGDLLARQDDTNARNAVDRLQALHEQAVKSVARLRSLVETDAVSQSLLDDAEAQSASLAAQLSDARTALARTRIIAPVTGTIQRRMVSVGDYRGIGDALFQLSSDSRLRAALPYPERLADRLAVGQLVRLESPVGGGVVEATVTEIRPMVGTASRAVELIVELDNPGAWRAGASVNAELVLDTRPESPHVPTLAVIQRPAGPVVYILDGERVRQRVVEVGVRSNGEVEIMSGLHGGERVVVDGAGFLTDGARVSDQGSR